MSMIKGNRPGTVSSPPVPSSFVFRRGDWHDCGGEESFLEARRRDWKEEQSSFCSDSTRPIHHDARIQGQASVGLDSQRYEQTEKLKPTSPLLMKIVIGSGDV